MYGLARHGYSPPKVVEGVEVTELAAEMIEAGYREDKRLVVGP